MTDRPSTGSVDHTATDRLPAWSSVLAVVAHPDDESFGLGAVLSTFIEHGARASVLCFTRGEASTLGPDDGDLSAIRAEEFAGAADVLGVSEGQLSRYPDGRLQSVELTLLTREALDFAARLDIDGILAFDPSGITGHPDHQRATEVAVRLAQLLGIGALGWTLPQTVAATLKQESGAPLAGHAPADIDLTIEVDRRLQRRAIACHPSQALPTSILWRRLELLGPREHLRWLHRPDAEGTASDPPRGGTR